MRTASAFFLASILLTLSASAPLPAGAAQRHSLGIDGAYSGLAGSFDLKGDYVFRDEASWCNFWARAFVFPPISCPAVDFRRQVVIATVDWQGGCSDFAIESVERVGSRHSRRAAEVLVEHRVPGPDSGCICTAGITMASRAVVVDKPITQVAFDHEFVEFSCHNP